MINEILLIAASLLAGAGFVFFLMRLNRGQSKAADDTEKMIARIKESFGELSLEALSRITSEFQKFSKETLEQKLSDGEKELEGKKRLIDQTLAAMKTELESVRNIVSALEKDREKKFGEITIQLKTAAEINTKLTATTNKLQSALASRSTRGQWGQRMAEDILRLVGFIENINYCKEKALDLAAGRPDYTFFLPQGRKVNMDVKFPLDNYLRYTETENEGERERYKELFLRDARIRVKEVTTRSYINPEENTLDYVIVFIPNEQVYSFINENDRELLDEALKNKVIVCSPLTLYAILVVIRQAMDNFNLEKTASEILSLLGAFNKQWDAFINSFEKLGRKIKEAQDEFDSLASTRRTQLERQIRKIEDLRKQKGISEPNISTDDIISLDDKLA